MSSTFLDTIIYWKLKELEETLWCGTLFFRIDDKLVGRVFFNKGLISWAEAVGQKHTILTAMKNFAQIDRDDILFANSIYEDEGKKSNFVSVLENSGLVQFWTFRESMRVHIFSAVLHLSLNENIIMEEDSDKTVEASQHVFTVDELIYAQLTRETKSFDLISNNHISLFEIRIRERGLIMRWPENNEEDRIASHLAKAHKQNILQIDDYAPEVITYSYPTGSYLVRTLVDVFASTIVIHTDSFENIDKLTKYLIEYPTLLIMQLSETTIPLISMI